MTTPSEPEFVCSECDGDVHADDQFCGSCGCVLADGLFCATHTAHRAIGRCVICGTVFCSSCGGEKFCAFLCDQHWHFEITEGMARVFGSLDNVQVELAASRLRQAGFHPFVYSRRFNPGAGMFSDMLKLRVRNYGRHPIAEIKILVPFTEVLHAERALKELSLAP